MKNLHDGKNLGIRERHSEATREIKQSLLPQGLEQFVAPLAALSRDYHLENPIFQGKMNLSVGFSYFKLRMLIIISRCMRVLEPHAHSLGFGFLGRPSKILGNLFLNRKHINESSTSMKINLIRFRLSEKGKYM